MTKDEALKLALEFIELVNKDGWILADFEPQMYEAMNAIKEALAQPEQEPVACVEYIPCCPDQTCPKCKATTPPQRTWVGLTDEEIKDCFKITPDQHLPWHIYQRIEAKLKEKNT